MLNFANGTANGVLEDTASMLYANSMAGQNMVSCVSRYGAVQYSMVLYIMA